MIKVCMFDMGGVLVRDFLVAPKLLPYLGRRESGFSGISPLIKQALISHSKGELTEQEFWSIYERITNSEVPHDETSLLAKFFAPKLDLPTLKILSELKNRGARIICGTNVHDAHYSIHQALHQYDIFDQVYASHLMHCAKPDGAFFRTILQQEQVKPDEMFFTDDMQENVLSAQTEGLAAYLYTGADQLRSQLCTLGLLS
ncbi:MAG: HAD family hydrolase [Sphaerochaeta sp.]|uniref:HAD family hydrolase n=1 Tax=Sphaerochaeta sp. TaxID=1972642 RepID=UPI003D0EF00C